MKKRDRAESGGGFISGVLILSLSTLIVKIIGLAFKIPMLSLLGMEGMGYFNSAYEIYAMLCVASTAGMPVALSILVSSARARGDFYGIDSAYRSARRIFLIFGATGAAIMIIGARALARGIGNDEAFYCILAIAPALLFICLASAVRGYCQGFGNMKPTAISQLIEAVSKLALGVLFAFFALKKGYSISIASACGVLGITVGTLLSLCYLWIARVRLARQVDADSVKRNEKKAFGRGRELLRIALPITLGSAIISFTRIVDMSLMLRRLCDVGISQFRANEIYGAYTTLALPVFGLIPSLITPISMALIPELTGFIERKRVDGQIETVEKALRLTAVFSMPASIAVTVFSRQILSLLFRGQDEAINIAAPLLSLLGASVFFSCLITTTNAILQAYGCVGKPVFSMSIGVAVKAISSYFLLGAKGIGEYGAPIGSLACNVTVTLLNFALILRYAPNSSSAIGIWRGLVKPFVASLASVGTAFFALPRLSIMLGSELVGFAAAVIVAILIYCAIALLWGILTRDDIRFIPVLNKLVKNK